MARRSTESLEGAMALLIAASLFLAAGAVFTALAIRELVAELRFVSSAQQTLGTVIGYSEFSVRTWPLKQFAPQISFHASDGRFTTFRGQVKSPFKQYRIGDKVPLLLGTKSGVPRVSINSADRWFSAVAEILIGVALAAVGVFAFAVAG